MDEIAFDSPDLDEAYARMTQDQQREAEARDWAEALLSDAGEENVRP